MSSYYRFPWITALAIGGMVILLVIEIRTHVLGTVGYVALAGSALWLSERKSQLLTITICASILLITGYLLAISLNHPKDQTTFVVNRLAALVVVWSALYFTLRHRDTQARELKHRQELEEIRLEEERLKSSLKIYQAIARNFSVGWIGILDENLTYVVADGKGLTRVGLSANKITGQSFTHVFRSEVLRSSLEEARGGQNVKFEVQLNGRTLEVVACPLLGIHKDQWILVVVHDITTLKETEGQLVKALERERKLGEMKSQFVTMASHEFRTPLATILSSASLLSAYTGDKLEKDKGKHIARIKHSVRQLTDILSEFLLLQRLEEEGVKLYREEISLPLFLDELRSETELLKQDAQQELTIAHTGKETLVSDPQVLKKILYNLMSNAFKFSPGNGLVTLEAVVQNGFAQFHVSDAGIGIRSEDREHIFKKFFRGQNAANIQGVGLGLTIVDHYIKAMPECEISFSSVPEKKTVFTVSVNEDFPTPTG